jgi:hypothetical protein
MSKKLKKIFQKVIEILQIRRIRNSKYFNEEYYYKNNADVKMAGIDAATHFYHFGWKENRKPCITFDVTKCLTKYPEINKLNINPIIYILDKGLEKTIDNLQEKVLTVSDLVKTYFSQSNPLKTLPVEINTPRINICFNGFDKGCFFGGKATALILAIKLAQKYNYKLRIISQNPDKQIFYEFLDLFNITFNSEIEFFSIGSLKFLEISKNDHFICTMWNNADSVLNTKTVQGKIFYIMQEVETFFYDHGDYHLRCFNTLTSNSLIPIVNSKLLYDYLLNSGYTNLKSGIYFEPSFLRNLLKPSSTSFKKKKKYKLFFYARPSHQRNLFYFGINILNQAFLTGVLDNKEWEVYLAGDEKISDFKFDVDVKIKNLGVMPWNEYCKFASSVDLCYSMIYTPHPSYPPFDMACAGAVVVTNKYANKKDLHIYSNNIISANLNEDDMLEKIKEGVKLVKNIKKRKSNYLSSNLNSNWDDSFRKVIPFIKNKIKEN